MSRKRKRKNPGIGNLPPGEVSPRELQNQGEFLEVELPSVFISGPNNQERDAAVRFFQRIFPEAVRALTSEPWYFEPLEEGHSKSEKLVLKEHSDHFDHIRTFDFRGEEVTVGYRLKAPDALRKKILSEDRHDFHPEYIGLRFGPRGSTEKLIQENEKLREKTNSLQDKLVLLLESYESLLQQYGRDRERLGRLSIPEYESGIANLKLPPK